MPSAPAANSDSSTYTRCRAWRWRHCATSASPPPALDIRVVRDAAEHDVQVQTDAAGFEGSLDHARKLFPPSLITRPYAAEFLGFVDGVPVATSVLVATGRTAGVYGVATIPEYRRRGYGEAMTWHAVREGIARGCEMANLQASDMGRPTYERMGFRVVAPFLIFARPATDSRNVSERDGVSMLRRRHRTKPTARERRHWPGSTQRNATVSYWG